MLLLWTSSPTNVLALPMDRLPSSYAALGPKGPNPRTSVSSAHPDAITHQRGGDATTGGRSLPYCLKGGAVRRILPAPVRHAKRRGRGDLCLLRSRRAGAAGLVAVQERGHVPAVGAHPRQRPRGPGSARLARLHGAGEQVGVVGWNRGTAAVPGVTLAVKELGMRHLLFAVLALTLAVPAIAAVSPPGVNIRWDNCFDDGGATNKTFACDMNAGKETLVLSFVLDAPMTNVSGMEF